ncbi:hypothetical protein [Methanolobus psychrotolerans]|uniref:hypothetical protein n=1 Tax=Methanolobus psychrotolerans TaxID=1874706 RepID=UPI0013EACFD7|nr:hypothetical protein [Methanolobus psychrotolerans]
MKSLKSWIETNDIEYGGSVAVQNDDDDADYKPILQGVINTRCNYDGAKIEGIID